MKKYEAIIYDIDGTLLNTLNMNMYPLMKIIKEETGEDWTFEQVLKFAAYPGMKVMEELGVKDQEKTYARWVQYVNDYEDKATLYKGFEEVLETFKNHKIKQAIVSSKLRDQYEIDIVSKGIDQYMSAVILEDDTTHHKPHPEPLLKCIEKLNLNSDEVIYIGDAYSDYQAALNAGCSKEAALHACYENSRDNARTPMQWDNSLHGGFTTGTPWLAENPNYTKINVTDQMNRSDSVLSFYKELIALRKAPEYVETFTYGTFAAAYEDVDHMFAYYRTNEETGQRILVAGNFGTDTVTLPLEKPADRVLLTNGKTADVILTRNRESASLVLGSCDCVVLLL